MVTTKMEKRLEALESGWQRQREEDGERYSVLTTSIASLIETLLRLEGRLDGWEANHGQNHREGQSKESSVTFNGGNRRERGHEVPFVGFDGGEDATWDAQWRKLDLPLFHGEDAYSWVDRMERYFEIRGIPEEQWLYATNVAMDGKVPTWFRWW